MFPAAAFFGIGATERLLSRMEIQTGDGGMQLEQVYWACLVGGALFAVITVVFGDLISNMLDGLFDFLSINGHKAFQPMTVVGAIAVFGGAGILLTRYTGLTAPVTAVLSVLTAVAAAVVVHFLYVRPMERSENSTGFSMQDLEGKIGEVIVPIPPRGYGEVLIKAGAANTNQIAASFDGDTIEAGARVVVVQVRDDTVYVSRLH